MFMFMFMALADKTTSVGFRLAEDVESTGFCAFCLPFCRCNFLFVLNKFYTEAFM